MFWRRGFDKTSLDTLMVTMHVGRQSLDDTFGDKREFHLRALDAYRVSRHVAMRAL